MKFILKPWVYVIILFAQCVRHVHLQGIIVIPGLGRADRLQTVVSNIKLLEHNHIKNLNYKWDCVVYVYAERSDTSFWSHSSEISYVQSLCTIIENVNKRVTENLYMLQPALIKRSYIRVFIMLD